MPRRKQDYMPIEPDRRADGSCSKCYGRLCEFHQLMSLARDRARAKAVAEAADISHAQQVAHTMARFELESDERGTATEKAERILDPEYSKKQRLKKWCNNA